MWRLDGVRAVITGGTKGIGLETVKEFVSLGAHVLIVSRSAADVESLISNLQAAGRVHGCAADVSISEGRAALLQKVHEIWGDGLDVLVNNVGVNIRARIEDQSETDYRTMMATNIDSCYFLCKAVALVLLICGYAVYG